ncbi:MAG: succinyl-diaminopimelate desuccinylase [Rickettsiaceae bacterium]|nr:succinyl-diaminopimelate desuccinylase [Rickettsiaceae bacterium]
MNLEILKNLISAASVSPKDDGLIDYIENILKNLGFRCYVQSFGTGDDKTLNLYAEYGEKGPNLCFAGHVDIVPSGPVDLWKYNPYEMNIEEDYIFGRGAVDMKGAIYCMICALQDWVSNKPNGKVSILLTSDEEAKATYGTKKMLEWIEAQNIKIDFAIVGEPSCSREIGDTIKIGRRGSINCSLTILGTQGHVAYPEKAVNPHDYMVNILSKLQSHKFDEGNKLFDPSNLEIVSIDTGNKVLNLIPDKTRALFNIRNSNISSAEYIIDEIEKIISSTGIEAKNYKLDYVVSAESFMSKQHSFVENFVNIVKKITGINPILSTSGGTSDARFIKNYCSVLEFGLLNHCAHKVNENTQISHLQKLHKVYIGAIKSFHET